jgi:hypothetical protein
VCCITECCTTECYTIACCTTVWWKTVVQQCFVQQWCTTVWCTRVCCTIECYTIVCCTTVCCIIMCCTTVCTTACVAQTVWLCMGPPFFLAPRPNAGYDLIHEVSRSHSDTPHLVGLLWTSDQLDAETRTWQRTAHTTDRHPCPRWDSNRQSQQASGLRPTP